MFVKFQEWKQSEDIKTTCGPVIFQDFIDRVIDEKMDFNVKIFEFNRSSKQFELRNNDSFSNLDIHLIRQSIYKDNVIIFSANVSERHHLFEITSRFEMVNNAQYDMNQLIGEFPKEFRNFDWLDSDRIHLVIFHDVDPMYCISPATFTNPKLGKSRGAS